MKIRALVLAALFCASPVFAGTDAPAPAAAPETPATPAPAAPAADPNEQVCKVERQIGSNKLKRVCRTRAQIDAEREAAREAIGREQRR